MILTTNKFLHLLRQICAFIFVGIFSAYCFGQQTGSMSVSGNGKLDVGRLAIKKCRMILSRKIGNNTAEVRFAVGYDLIAGQILEMLSRMITETSDILQPRELADVRFYLLPLNKNPVGYRYNLINERKNLYQTIGFIIGADQPLDCRRNQDLCENILTTIPHELTHSAIEGILSGQRTRWFEEGLSEYVAWKIADRLNPLIAEEKLSSRNTEFVFGCVCNKERIFNWSDEIEQSKSPLLNRSSNLQKIWGQQVLYGASFQLVRLLMQTYENEGLKSPTGKLLALLAEYRKQKDKIVDGEELTTILQQLKPFDLTSLMTFSNRENDFLSAKAQQNLITATDEQTRFYALNQTACLQNPVNEKAAFALLKIVFGSKEDETDKSLAATALMKISQIDEVLKNYNENRKSGNPTLGDAKKIIREKSLQCLN